MKDTIYKQIQEQSSLSFDQLFLKNSEQISNKGELGTFLRELETEKKIFQFSNQYHDLNKFETVQGFIQWNLNGFCWLSENQSANAWGISFDPSENLLSVYNKRDALIGSTAQAKKIVLEDKEFVFITETHPDIDYKAVASYNANQQHWVVLNSSTIFNFKNEVDAQAGDVAIFNVHNNQYEFNHSLGNIQDKGIESKIIELLAEVHEAPSSDFENLMDASNKVKPLLDKDFYTIDSLYTNDVDDAIYIEKETNGFALYVAIANVSSYVLPGDIQDKHAHESCTSVYLPHKTIHMLDRKLAENYCSLNVGQPRSSLVCEMHFDAEGRMLSHDFSEAQILVKARLTYDDVDKMIQGRNPSESLIFKNNTVGKMTDLLDNQNIAASLKILEQFASFNNRHQDKAFFIVEQPEYHLGEDGKIDYLYPKEENSISQKMVESAMLCANISAAQFLFEKYPTFGMFRNQFEPALEDKPKPAFYDYNNQGHWGLQTEFYTHFTSPIRRICDLMVHRFIKGIIYNNDKLYENEDLGLLAENMNLQQYKSKQCAIKAKNLLVPQYIEKLYQTGQLSQKIEITDFSENGIACRNNQLVDVFIPTFKLEKDIVKALSKFMPLGGEELDAEAKKTAVIQLNQNYDIYMKLNEYSWSDDKKNALYQFQRKRKEYKPK